MRRAISLSHPLAVLPLPLALVTGCPAEVPPPRAPRPVAAASEQAPPRVPPHSYTIADPDALPKDHAVPLDDGGFGVLSGGSRVLVRGEDFRVAKDVTSDELTGVERVPARLGGGFLFLTIMALYSSPTFDGPLHPITLLEGLSGVSFGPRSALLHTYGGDRYLYDLASGAALPIAPLGLIDVLALDDGRAAALVEGGRAMISLDHGERWSDVTAKLDSAPTALVSRPREIWIGTHGAHAFRLDPGSALLAMASVPPVVAGAEPVRARDPAWRGDEAPLVAAVRRGAHIDDGAVIVVVEGNVVRVDPRSGAVKIVAAGRVPSELRCEALRVGEDVIAVCALPGRPSVVVAHLASGDPTIERTFPVEGPFYATDEGSLVFGGSCDGARMRVAVCVRDAAGAWHEHSAAPAPGGASKPGAKLASRLDAGPDAPDPNAILRWVIREGVEPLAILGGRNPGTFNPESDAFHAWQKEDNKAFPADILLAFEPPGAIKSPTGKARPGGEVILDRRWSIRAGVLRGWLDAGQLLKIHANGEVERSAFIFPGAATSGNFGFVIDAKDRSFQTIDHGETWNEVTSPPVAHALKTVTAPRCSPLGCDLGLWLRFGWDASPPSLAPAPPLVPQPPPPPQAPLPQLTCASAGEERFSKLASTPLSPTDLGLGARRLPVTVSENVVVPPFKYQRHFYARGAMNPAKSMGWGDEPEQAPRALLHGLVRGEFNFAPPVRRHVVQGGFDMFRQEPDVFRRDIAFLEPFDTDSAVRATSFFPRDLDAALRPLGPASELGESDIPEPDSFAPILSLDPAGPRA